MATKILVCLVMIAAAAAVPLIRDDFDSEYESYTCARKCTEKPSKFNYRKSSTYVYEYKAEADSSVIGASMEKAEMFIETLANIEVMDTCEFALRLQDVKVFHSQPFSSSPKPAERLYEFQRALTENTLRFSFDDGVIRDICHPHQEKIWVLNFKRGLLSAFQNSMNGFKSQEIKEIDVTGECDVEYTSNKWSRWSSTKVTKSKNLTACYQRSNLRTFIPMVPYKISSEIQSLPILKSSHECEQIISTSKILESSVCNENHIFAPLSNHQSGASTKIKQSLVYKALKSTIETSQDYIESRSNLLFQHQNGINAVSDSREKAEQKLKEICEQTKTDIRPETPILFRELVQIVKVLDISDLKKLLRNIKRKKLCNQNDKSMKFLLDTLPIAGTSGAVELMVSVINGDYDIPDVEKNVWLTSISLIPDPTDDILPSLLKLVSGNFADQALLPVSALLNTICRKNVDCDQSYQFKKIVSKIRNNIDSSCTSKDQSQLMETLRAIGNVGYGKDFLKTLKTCLSSSYAPLSVKVAAADAYRRFKCEDDEETEPLFEQFVSSKVDSELRIMAFLSLMRCPRNSILQKVAAQLDKEEDVNVGTFVYTHLKNLRETSDPHKQDIAKAVERINLRKFEDSGFKTSRCFESSTLLNRINLGYVADGDLIWSQSSLVPRSMRLNLTVEMFGNSINLFEAGARVEGLDGFIQKYFDMSQKEVSPKDLEAFIYARMFGNELLFKHMKGTQEYEKVKSYFNFDKLLDNLSKKYDFGYTHSQQLMDHSLIVPSIIGLPLNLTVYSSVTVDTRAKGIIDFSGILSRSKPIAVSNDITASAGLEVSGLMMIDAQFYKHGLRMRNTLHSSVALKSNLMIKGRQIVNFEIESPQQKQELFDARSQFFLIQDNYEREQEMITDNKQQFNSCTGEKFAKVTGLEVCGELRYPNASTVKNAPYFPLTGPARATLFINKKDTQRSYKIFAKWIKNSRKLESQLHLDTPGSRVDRHITADITVAVHKNPHVDFVLISPWKKIVLNGKAAKTNDIASLTGSLAIDEDIQYKLTTELKMSSKARSHQYFPFVEVENNGERITILSGSAVHNEKKDITSNFELKDLNQRSYTVGGRLVYSPQEKRIELSAGRKGEKPFLLKTGSIIKKSGRKNVKVNPDFLIQYPKGEIVSLKSNGEFQSSPLRVVGDMSLNAMRIKKPVIFKVDVRHKKSYYPVTVKLSTPVITGDVKGRVNVRKNSYSTDMTAKYRAGSVSDKVSWNAKLLDRTKNSYIQYDLTSNLKFKNMPEYTTMSTLQITHKRNEEATSKKSTAELTVYYGKKAAKQDKSQVIQVLSSVNLDLKKKTGINADLKAKVPEKNVDIKMDFNHLHNSKKLDSDVKLHLAPLLDNDINANILIQNKGRSLYSIAAESNLEAGGQKYRLESTLDQKSQKRYDHSLTVITGDEDKHTVVTVYKNANNNNQLHTSLESTQIENPLYLDVSLDLEKPSDFHVRGALKEKNRELYSLVALSKLEEGGAGKWNLEIAYPARTVRARANFNNNKNKIMTSAMINWDVTSPEKPAPEVVMTGQFNKVIEQDSLSLKGNVKLSTPFKNWEKLSSNWNLEKSESNLKSTGKLSWGGIHKQISSGLTAQLPISIENVKISFEAKTPFKNYKDVELEVDHMLNSEIKSILRGKLERDQAELILNGKKDINDDSRAIEGELTLRTPYRLAKKIVLTLEHSDDESEIKSKIQLNKDGQKYQANLISSSKHDSERRGRITLSGPERSAQTSYTHKIQNGKHEIEAFIDSALQNKKRQYNVDITGHYLDLTNLKLNVDVKSPLKSLRKGGLEIGFKLDDEALESKVIVVQNRGKTGYDVTLKNKQREISSDILLLLSPMYENDVYFKSLLQYDDFPFTLSSQLSLAPYKNIDLLVSYKAPSIDDLEVGLKLTTSLSDMKNIDLVASNVLKNSVRVSHLYIDYDLRKMIDVEVRSRNEDEKKLLRLKFKLPMFTFESVDTGVSIDMTNGIFSKADFELIENREEKYEGVVSLKVSRNDNVRGKLDIKTPVKGFKHIKGSLVSEGRKFDMTNTLLLTWEDEKMVEISSETKNRRGKWSVTVDTQGTLFQTIAEEYSDFLKTTDIDDYIPNVVRYNKEIAKKLTTEIIMEETDKQAQWTVKLNPDFKSGPRETLFKFKHSGESWTDFDIASSLTVGGDTLSGKTVVKLVDSNDIKFESVITFPHKEVLGIEFSLLGDLDQVESKGGLKFFFIESNFTFMMNSIQHIEFTSTTTKLRRTLSNPKFLKVKYVHEGQDNRASCSLSVEDQNGIRASINLVGQVSPIYLFSLVIKSPFEDFKKVVISGNYDETKINAFIELNEKKQLSLTGSHQNLKDLEFTLKTPLLLLQTLTLKMDGELSDGSSKFSLHFNDYEQINGNIIIKYDSLSEMELISALTSKIDEIEKNLKFEIENSVEPRKSIRLLLSSNDVDKIALSSHWDKDYNDNDKLDIDLNLLYPSLGTQHQGLNLKLEGNTEKATGTIEVLGSTGKILDADIDLDIFSDKKATLTLRQPKSMEYSFTRGSFQNENEIYLNWDKTDPDANLVIGATYKDDSDFYKFDKSVSLSLSCPRRSIGVEHTITATRAKVKSSGKLYWDRGFGSQVSYYLNLKDQSNRRKKSYGGDVKFTLPTRTIGVAGSASDLSGELQAETTLSWDLDRDSTKKVGLKGTLFKGSHTQADISLILPKDAHVDNKLVMNKGNTILEGETQIFYSDDSRKTVTLFSKLEKNPGHNNFFFSSDANCNYSIQFGLSHPDSRIDMKMNSHLGMDSERLTTSVGLDYLTSRRQTKNMDLFMEINKLKKEINLISVTPYKSVSLSGAVISQDPVDYKGSLFVDDEERYAAHLMIDPTQKKANFDWTTYGTTFSYSAFFPNKTALQIQREQETDGQRVKDVIVLFHLPTPYIFQSTLNWRRGLIVEARDRLFDNTESFWKELKDLVDDVGLNLKKEVEQKYRDISFSIFDDAKSILNSVEQEIILFENDLDTQEQTFDFCGVPIEDIIPLSTSLKVRLNPVLTRVKENIQSLSEILDELKKIPAEEVFEKFVKGIENFERRVFTTAFWRVLKGLYLEPQEKFDKFWDDVDKFVQKLDPQEGIDALNKEMKKLRNVRISTLVMNILERYEIVTSLKKLINELEVTKEIKEVVEDSDIYRLAQQYGMVEKVNELKDELITLMIEIVDEEIRELLDSIRYLRNPITLFDPEKRVIQVELPLVFSLNRLDKIPTLEDVTGKLFYYIPEDFFGGNDSSTVQGLTLDSDLDGFYEYNPSPRHYLLK